MTKSYTTTAAQTLAALALFASATTFATADNSRRGWDDRSDDDNGQKKGWVMGIGNQKKHDRFMDKRDAEVGADIKNDGSVVLRGAKVTAVSASSVTVTETLGSVTLTWTAALDGATKLEGKQGQTIALTDIIVGDIVTIKGTMVSGSTLAVKAALVRDINKLATPTPSPITSSQQIFEGTLSVLPGATFPATLTLTIGGVAQVVNISTTTTVLNTAWSPIALSTFAANDQIRVFGFIPSGSTAVTALVVRNMSR